MESLENICKKKLQIGENISVIEIADFLEKNKIYNLDFLFLINFKTGKRAKNFKIVKDCFYLSHEILAFKKMKKNYCICCKVKRGSKFLYYKKYTTDDKDLIQKMESEEYKKIEGLGFFKFLNGKNNIFFVPRDFKKDQKIYESLNNYKY